MGLGARQPGYLAVDKTAVIRHNKNRDSAKASAKLRLSVINY
jgi:hypothetical protein